MSPYTESVTDARAADIFLLTFDTSKHAASHITTVHFTLALINPVPNISM